MLARTALRESKVERNKLGCRRIGDVVRGRQKLVSGRSARASIVHVERSRPDLFLGYAAATRLPLPCRSAPGTESTTSTNRAVRAPFTPIIADPAPAPFSFSPRYRATQRNFLLLLAFSFLEFLHALGRVGRVRVRPITRYSRITRLLFLLLFLLLVLLRVPSSTAV